MQLVKPSMRYAPSYLAAECELADERAVRTTPESVSELLTNMETQSDVVELWLVDDSDYLGKLQLRRTPQPPAGHIGFEIRPSRRRGGLVRVLLELARPHVDALGITRIEVTCSEANAVSRHIIERYGGVYVDRLDAPHSEMRRYAIDLATRP